MPQVLHVYSLALPHKALHCISLVVGELAIQYSAPAGFLRGHQVVNYLWLISPLIERTCFYNFCFRSRPKRVWTETTYPHLPQTQLDFVQELFGQAMAGPTALEL